MVQFYDVNSNAIDNGTVFYGLRRKKEWKENAPAFQPAIFPTEEDAEIYLRSIGYFRAYEIIPVMFIHHEKNA